MLWILFSVATLILSSQGYKYDFMSADQSSVVFPEVDFPLTVSNLPSTLSGVSIIRLTYYSMMIDPSSIPNFYLISPSGTKVALFGDKSIPVGGHSQVQVRDDASVSDLGYSLIVLPLERINQFKGENPNGVWLMRAQAMEIPLYSAMFFQSWKITIIDECEENPCLNDGICKASTLSCECTPNFSGSFCENGFNIIENNLILSAQPHYYLHDFTSIESYVDVPQLTFQEPIQVKVTVYFPHPYIGDLILTLVSPTGNVTLMNMNGNLNYFVMNGGTEFSDDAIVTAEYAEFISGETYPSLLPIEGSLNSLVVDSSLIHGKWYLIAQDIMDGASGTLYKWTLSLSGVEACDNQHDQNALFSLTSPNQNVSGNCIPGYYGSIQKECILIEGKSVWSTLVIGNCISCPLHSSSLFGAKTIQDCFCDTGFIQQENECIPLFCLEETIGFVTYPNTSIGNTFSGCPLGTVGNIQRTCIQNGHVSEWLDPVGNCAPSCSEDSNFSETDPGETSYFNNCNVGEYGILSRYCNLNGEWEDIQSNCQQCPSGYTSTLSSISLSDCFDINECEINNGDCPSFSNCFNTEGSRNCQCFTGFEMIDNICQPNTKSQFVNTFQPILRYLFDGNGYDTSGNGISAIVNDLSFQNYYQNEESRNQAIILNSSNRVLSSSLVTLQNRFSVEILFNLNSYSFSTNYNLFSLIPTNSANPVFTVTGDNLAQLMFHSPKILFKTKRIVKTGRTNQLIFTIRNGQIVIWLNQEKLATLAITFPASGQYTVSMGQGLIGHLDEVGLYATPVWESQIPTFSSFYTCTNTCPIGKVCINTVSGPSCA